MTFKRLWNYISCEYRKLVYYFYRKPGDEDQKGRSSGAAAWRLARKEVSETGEERNYTWFVNSSDIVDNSVLIRYSASINRYEYISSNRKIKELVQWHEGAHEHSQIFRKEEKDWNMVYLARMGLSVFRFLFFICLCHSFVSKGEVTV